ncbi:MAG: bifunctional phosphopantothenoylcysteine decarboxylase/phosphopantothenate--cysteine ligase CoaBC [Crocinitomicaceae bacterium]|nr:bifunctional phosphopantothenoylcysteine decarboxylase/phosphopantothenate--cysteine ligase CoaBC [Crocinitomicaceae bacterium]|tara:strand:+ start:107010 stop:108212 length:1203 start_codon:yes stop_codon:yes gene_type:complete
MRGKRILLGITGGIAAYKIPFLIRLLIKAEAEVKCIMTPASCDFISPLVLSTLSGNPVAVEFWNKKDGSWNNHVEYGLWADVFVIAPLTKNTLSKMALGSCDNLLLATYLSMKTNTLVAPAMDLDMYNHASTKSNFEKLSEHGVEIIPVEYGELASGLVGDGRMSEPENIFNSIHQFFDSKLDPLFKNKNVLITAGPTCEEIDPVRYISNYSSGKMGYSLANEFLNQGAIVTLISGPTNLKINHPNLSLINVKSAEEMLMEVKKAWKHSVFGIFSAAVSDYRPKKRFHKKVKKSSEELKIELIKNPDILFWASQNKKDNQYLVGFSLETNDVKQNAKKKLELKKLDIVVMNSLEDLGAGFGFDTNKISILDNKNNFQDFDLKSKDKVAKDIVLFLKKYLS